MSDEQILIYFLSIIAIVILVIFVGPFTLIGPGERGVVLQFGAVTGQVMGEGLNFKIPIAQSIDVIDVKTQKLETQAAAASKDLQVVTSTIALNYRFKTENVIWLRQNIGKQDEIKSRVIDPAIQEAIKAATAQFTAEELITKRPLVREQMKLNLQEKLNIVSSNSIEVVEFNIVNFDFSEQFNRAIEEKVTAEQLALKAQRDLERIKIEAQQKIESAKAEAESIKIQSQALRENPDILQLRWIEKWDGMLPVYVGGENNLLLNLPNLQKGDSQ